MYTSERLSMLERESDEQNLMEMKTLIFLTIDLHSAAAVFPFLLKTKRGGVNVSKKSWDFLLNINFNYTLIVCTTFLINVKIMHNIYFDRLLRNQPQETQKAQEETQEEEGPGGGLCCGSGGRGRVRGHVRRGGPKDRSSPSPRGLGMTP